MSLPLRILPLLTSGSSEGARMRLECELRTGKYFLFALEGRTRWAVLPPGADPRLEERGLTRGEALKAALLAGFSDRETDRALRKAEARPRHVD